MTSNRLAWAFIEADQTEGLSLRVPAMVEFEETSEGHLEVVRNDWATMDQVREELTYEEDGWLWDEGSGW